jgi:hypothetical protein
MAFEARLSNALERYADRVPAESDIAAVVRMATSTPVRHATARPPFAWRGSVWLRLGVAVALLALAALLIAIIGRPRTPPLGGGSLMVSLGTAGWIFEPALGAPRQVEVVVGCGSTLMDGGAQLVDGNGRFQAAARIRPIDADLSAGTGLFTQNIPGYGGTNSEWWAPDGGHIALIRYAKQNDDDPPDGDGAILVVSASANANAKANAEQPIFEVAGLSGAAWSDDSDHIAVLARRGLNVQLTDIDVVRGVQRDIASYRAAVMQAADLVAWTAVGSKIAVWVATDEGDRPALVDVQSGVVTTIRLAADVPRSEFGTYELLWSPDGTRLLAIDAFANAVMVGADGSRLFDLPRGHRIDAFRGPTSWAPDGRHLALLDGDAIHVIRSDGHEVGSIPFGSAVASSQWLAWSPDGSAFAVATPHAASLELVLYDADSLAKIASATMPTQPPVTGEGMCLQWVRPID